MNSEFEKNGGGEEREVRLTPLEGVAGATCNAYTARIAGKKVFVKEIKEKYAADGRMLAAFRKEAEIGFRLSHPNLPHYIYAEGVLPSDRYIVQEFIDGQSLPDFIRSNPDFFADKKHLREFILQLADTLDYLHANQILFLDLKPDNIIITRIGHAVKLTDLGFCSADFYEGTEGFTPGYKAPERSGEPRTNDMAADYYSLGKVLEYIRHNSKGYPGNRFKRLEKLLLSPIPEQRISSADEIERQLKPRITPYVWVACFFAAIILTGVLILLPAEPAAEIPESVPPEAIEEQEAILEIPLLQSEAIPTETQNTASIQQPSTPTTPNESNEKQEANPDATQWVPINQALLREMGKDMIRDIRDNFRGFKEMVEVYIRENRFSESDRKHIYSTLHSATYKVFQTNIYKQRYKDFSPSLIDDYLAEVFKREEDKDWGPPLKEYESRYQQSLKEGSSK